MNSITSMNSKEATMTSKEIADLCEARHNDVTQTIERLKEKGVLRSGRKTRKIKPDGGGRSMSVYDLTKRDTLIVVSGYRDEVRAKIIDRWMELEEAERKPLIDLSDPASVRDALLDYAQRNIALTEEIEEAKPKVEALERIAEADGSHNMTEAAKLLQTRPKDLIDHLRMNAWIYRRAASKTWTGYQDKIQQGLLEHKVTTIQTSGYDRNVSQVRITPKGLTRLAKEIGE